jgi:rod shape-determining protein MreD
MVIVALALQTTLFARLRPFDAAPALVVLTVIAVARHLPPEQALVVGFLGGLGQDLLAESPLGLWALVQTTVSFVVVRNRGRIEDDITLLAPATFVMTIGALALFAVLGTIFGEKTLADSGIVKKMVLPSLYNVLAAPAVLPLVTRALGGGRRRAPFEL